MTDLNKMTVAALRELAAERNVDVPSKATKAQIIEQLSDETDNTVSVADIARELGISPKVARARLRRSGAQRDGKRWGRVERDSDEHAELAVIISPKAESDEVEVA